MSWGKIEVKLLRNWTKIGMSLNFYVIIFICKIFYVYLQLNIPISIRISI